jgi:DNA-binding NarL/FixJ family response regulator
MGMPAGPPVGAPLRADARPIRLMCVEHRPLICDALAALLNAHKDMRFVASASTVEEAVRLYRDARPDVVLMDTGLPQLLEHDLIAALRKEDPDVAVVAFTLTDVAEAQEAARAGARGWVLPTMTGRDLLATIRRVYRREPAPPVSTGQVASLDAGLTERELDVLRHIATGARNTDVAMTLGIGSETVKGHVRNILEKLGARSRAQAVAIAIRRGLFRR